jgi:hypothetical protein
MRRVMVACIFLSLAAGAFALPGGPGFMGPGDASSAALNSEITGILDQQAATQIGTMTVGDMEKLAGQISIAIQKEQYVRRAGMASMMLPGMGQFKTGDSLNGSLFLAGDIAVFAGTLLGAYFLLPSNVQLASMDYLNTPLSSIRTTWESNTLSEYGPSIAVAVGGMAVQMLLRWVSARNAREDARQAIDNGKVTFQPELVPLFGPMGPGGMYGMGMGMGFRWRQ